jgi:molybdopterin/thiamine biosynthesis adenylyltransferase
MPQNPDPEQTTSADLDRYVRQMRYAPLGDEGQRRLLAGRALVCGCGALGSVIANTLARSGVGYLRIVDRDFLETNNLQRQVLFDEDDVAAGLPKAIAAAAKLRKINSQITIEPLVIDVDPTNIRELTDRIDVILDGTDNFETRMLLNDVAIERNIPWVYGGCLGADGQTMTILPGETACLRCLMHDTPPPGTTPTCDTAGILAPIVNIIASLQANEAIKILSGNRAAISRSLTAVDVWDNRIRQINLDALHESGECPACHKREFPWLSGQRASHSAILCGRNAVQLSPPRGAAVSLATLAEKLRGVGRVTENRYLVRVAIDDYLLTIFPDGRAIIGGTADIATARGLYAKYIGN